MSRWQAVIFDLDDTLFLERDYVRSGFRAVAAWSEQNLGILSEKGFAELNLFFDQGVRGDTFNRWLAMHGWSSNDLVDKLVMVYREHEPIIEPSPQVPSILDLLHKSYKLGIVSDGNVNVQRRKLEALGLSHHFDAVIFSEELGKEASKPSTKPFNVILQILEVEGPRSIYVADNPAKDFIGARKAQMFTIRLRRAEGQYAHLDPPTTLHAPHVTLSSITELEQVLSENE